MLTAEQRTIDGIEFEIGMLPVKEARAVLVKLTKLLGPVIREFGKDPARALGDVDTSTLAAALAALSDSASAEDLDFLVARFSDCSKTLIGPNMVRMVPAVSDQVFAGRLLSQFRWLWACVEVNYADFFSALRDLAPQKRPAMASGSTSPNP